jgi:hypothetical protein
MCLVISRDALQWWPLTSLYTTRAAKTNTETKRNTRHPSEFAALEKSVTKLFGDDSNVSAISVLRIVVSF